MLRRRKPVRIWRILILLALIGAFGYVNFWIVPTTGPLFIPTPTPTRSPESYLADADALSGEGKFNQAIEAYKQAILSDPNNVNTYISLARAEIFNQKYEDAKNDAANALLLNNNNASAHATLGWAHIFLGDYLAAEASLDRAIELDPNNAQAHAYMAELLVLQNDAGIGALDTIDKAIAESKLAIGLGDNTMEAHRARGLVYYYTGNQQEAVDEFLKAISISPNIPDLHINLGIAYRALEVPELDKAVDEFTTANSLNPTDPMPDLYIARIYANIGEYTKAIQYAEQATQDAPSDPLMWGTLGYMFYEADKFQQAADAFTLAVKGGTTPEGVVVEGLPLDYGRVLEFYTYYSFALWKTGQCELAVPIATLILQGDADDENAVYNANYVIDGCTNPQPAATEAVGGEEGIVPTEEVGPGDLTQPTEAVEFTPTPSE